MTAPLTPGPDEPRALSSREREILAAIEDDLVDSEPRLHADLARGRSRRTAVTPRLLGLLLLVLTVLCAVGAALPDAAEPVLALLTVGLVVPWVLWCVRDHDPD